MAKIEAHIIRLLLMSILSFTALIEELIKKHLCYSNFQIHFLREQYWSVYFEMHFLMKLFLINLGNWLKWLLIRDCLLMWLLLCVFLIKVFSTSKPYLILTCSDINLVLLIIGCNQSRYVSRGTCLECLPPL